MTTPAIPTQPRTNLYFMVTLQWGGRITTYANVADVGPGAGRQEVTEHLLALAREKLSAPADAVVLFLSLEPEELTAKVLAQSNGHPGGR